MKITTVIIILFLECGISFVFAQTNSATHEDTSATSQESTSSAQNPVSSAPPAVTQEPSPSDNKESSSEKVVKDIQVQGNKSISVPTIMSKIKTRANQPYYARVVRDDIKRLYETGFFSDVTMDSEDYQEGLRIIIKVKEKPIVSEVIIKGMHVVRPDLMKTKIIKTKPEQYLDDNQLREDVSSLTTEYTKRGFPNVKINQSVELDEKTNKAKVIFNVQENTRVRIRRVYVRGNDTISYARIMRAIKTRRARIFHAGFFKEQEFQDDIERIKALYDSEGFSDATVDSKTDIDAKGFMYITLIINEGKKYLVGSTTIVGNKDISEEDLRNQLQETLPGRVFSHASLSKDVYNLRSYYLGKGYLFAQVREAASVDSATGKVAVSYSVQENQIAYVERIDITGNTKTKEKVIRRELRLKPGERFDGEKLRRSKERLEKLGYFQEIVFDTKSGSAPNKENLLVDVKETQTGSLSFGGGYSTVDQLIGFVEVEQKNFDLFNFPNFTGGGQDLALRYEIGSLRKNYLLSFTEPWLFDKPLSFGFDAFQKTHDKDLDVGYAYDEKRTGGDLRLGKELSEYLSGTLMYRLEQVEISNVDETISSEFQKETGKNVLSTVESGLTFDTRDSIFNPTKGTVLAGTFGCTGGPFGGDKDFTRWFGSAAYYFSPTKKSVVETKLRVGAMFPFKDTSDVPIYERYYAGGAETIRGYHERGIGPIDAVTQEPVGGEALFIYNIEYTYPIVEFIKIAAFFDSGNVWRKVEDFGSTTLKSGFGFGFRVKTPIGNIKLDYGFPLDKEPGREGKTGRLHFSMSRGF